MSAITTFDGVAAFFGRVEVVLATSSGEGIFSAGAASRRVSMQNVAVDGTGASYHDILSEASTAFVASCFARDQVFAT